MIDGYIIAWSSSLIGLIVSALGGIWYVSALKGLGGELKKSQIIIFWASCLWILYSALMITLALMGVPLTEKIWWIIPPAYTITSIAYVTGTYKLMIALKKLGQ